MLSSSSSTAVHPIRLWSDGKTGSRRFGSRSLRLHLNRAIDALIREAGFDIPDLHVSYMPGPKPFTFIHADPQNVRLSGLAALKQSFRFREEFRAPAGVRKSPRNEPAGRTRRSMGISVSR